VQLGVKFEVIRQTQAIEKGELILQETRGWNEAGEFSFPMRVKETENDYRYFPDPDLVPMVFDDAYIEQLRAETPELPLSKWRRYQADFGLSALHADQLIGDRETAAFFEAAVASGGDAQAVCNWMIADFAALLNETGKSPRQSKVTPAHLVDLTKLIADGSISGKIAKQIFTETYGSGKMPSEIVQETGLTQVSDDSAIRDACRAMMADNAEVVARFRSGQTGVKGFLVGQAMKAGKGQFKPQMVQDIIQELLDSGE
jgi:aspartyl-tRNA(Asn)/glutamyl-tRNA(Gln) amidotransferase subunit B